MDVREKLVELIESARYLGSNTSEEIADKLLDSGVTVQEWISVKERLPQEKVDCIVHYKHAYCDNDDYWAIGMCFYDGEKFQLGPAYKVTHWMPMPEPPKRRMIMAKCTGIKCPMQVGYKVDECNHKDCPYRTEPITNADRIRAMSDEELAEFLAQINPTNCQDCAFSLGWRCQPDRGDYSDFEKCKEGRKRWLQQPAEEET